MTLKPHDLHLTLDPSTRRLKVFNNLGVLIFDCEARNKTTADDGNYGHNSPCPPGEYVLGLPVPKEAIPFGFWFLPILDYGSHLGMAQHGRQGIGIHGGGSGLPQPFAGKQGFQITHGCWRVLNQDLARLAPLVQRTQQATGRVYVTVLAPSPGTVAVLPDDWAPLVELDPEE